MAAELLSWRSIIGMYYARLEMNAGQGWMPLITNLFNSDQPSETYAWLGMSPQMREWVGGRQARGFNENKITIENKHFEATLEVRRRDARRDKTGQIMVRVNDLADRTQSHWAKLCSELILNGAALPAYDGQYFFSTTHQERDSPVQSNKLTISLGSLPTITAGVASSSNPTPNGVPSNPNTEAMQLAIFQAVSQILSFVDDVGEPMNELAQQWLIMTPPNLYKQAEAAVSNGLLPGGGTNLIAALERMQFGVAMNARLLPWTDRFVVFRTDGSVKSIIRQEEEAVQMKAKVDGSDFAFDNDAWQFGVDAWRNVGLGYWQQAVQVILVP